jgi:hypothetical protein
VTCARAGDPNRAQAAKARDRTLNKRRFVFA